MGQYRETIYKAPDDSRYRVAADGSVQKISNGRSNPYVVSPEYSVDSFGKLYVLENGAYRCIGYAEKVSGDGYEDDYGYDYERSYGRKKPQNDGDNFVWYVLAIAFIVIVGILSFVFFSDRDNKPTQAKAKTVQTASSGKKQKVGQPDKKVYTGADDSMSTRVFSTTQIYYGIDNSYYPDEEYVKIKFYSSGKCHIKASFLGEGCDSDGTYYLQGNRIYITSACTDNEKIAVTLRNDGSFVLMGIALYPQ